MIFIIRQAKPAAKPIKSPIHSKTWFIEELISRSLPAGTKLCFPSSENKQPFIDNGEGFLFLKVIVFCPQ